MKNNTTSVVRFRSVMAAALLLAGLSSSAQTQSSNPGEAVIAYAGTVDNKLVFSVSYENKTAAPFTLDITDGKGFRFFSDRFSQASFRKFFALETDELGKTTLNIQLVTKDGVQKQAFDINASERVVNEVSVVKL